MTAILGISAFYHDSAAALVRDGEIVAAAQEERFSRKKHDASFPAKAIEYCLKEAGLTPGELDLVGFYDKPLMKFERLLETYLAYAPRGFSSFVKAMPVWLREKLHLPGQMTRGLDGAYRKRFIFTEHHESHAASAFFPSPFREAAILTVDGVGEWATATFGTGTGNRIQLTRELRFPHSPGLLYSAFTYFCGFRVNSGEYKLMGLAPYGEPRYVDLILRRLIDLKEDGSFRMDMSYFNYCQGLTMTSRKFDRLFGGPPREPETPLTEREMDLAASIQRVMEEILLRMARHVHERTGQSNLCLAGGVALNCVANGRILRKVPSKRSGSSPRRGTPVEPWERRSSSGTNCSETRAVRRRRTDRRVRSWAPPIRSRRSVPTLKMSAPTTNGSKIPESWCNAWPRSWPTRRWWGGCRAAWNSDPGPWGAGAFWETLAAAGCSR